jgi:hypothetical protein
MRTLRGQLNDYALPIFNMNGSSASSIAEEYLAALHAVKAAREAVAVTTCHGRDFQMQEPAVFTQAQCERTIALTHLDAVLDHIDAWLGHALDHS